MIITTQLFTIKIQMMNTNDYRKNSLLRLSGIVLLFALHVQFALCQKVIHEIEEKDVIPEGITFSAARNSFFVSSIFKNKIIEISKKGTRDFIKNGEGGFMGGVGLHIDEKRQILWACSGNIMGDKFRTGLFAYDLKSGRLRKKVIYPTSTSPTLFNDLAIDSTGSVYVTNTMDHSIWKWSLSMSKPEKLPIKEKITYANGIVLSPDEKYVFVASAQGIVRVNLSNYQSQVLPMQNDLYAKGLDGLGFYKNCIYGVHDEGVVKFSLSDALDSVTNSALIEKNNKHFDSPTTLAIYGKKLYVLPNSQLPNLDQKNIVIKNRRQLKKSVIIEYDLD